MALPPSTHACWTKLANGGLARVKTENIGIQLLAKRLEKSHDPVTSKAAEIRAFFVKWERALISEINQIMKL